MRKQIEWRVHLRTQLYNSRSFLQASAFHQTELHSAALDFEDEIAAFMGWMVSLGPYFRPSSQPPGFGNLHQAEWEEIATFWQQLPAPCAATIDLLDNYVHDSRAGFRVTGPTTEQEMHAYLRLCVQRRKEALAVVVGKADYGSPLTREEQRAADEYARTNKIPRFRVGGREPWNGATGLVSKGGYLRYRKIYSGSDTALIS